MRKYDPLINIDSKLGQQLIGELIPNTKLEWCIQEKIHGANFSIQKYDNKFEFCSRNQALTPESKFYNYQGLRFPRLNEINRDCVIYGEIYGKGVQKEVWYSNTVQFRAYDIYHGNTFMDVYECLQHLDELELPSIPLLFAGSLKDCLEYDTRFNSIIAEKGSNLTPETNLCEGVVIRPLKTLFDNKGNRVVFKRINDRFKERKATKKCFSTKPSIDASTYMEYLNENRINAVLSKEADVTIKDIGRLISLVHSDILEDMVKNGVEIEDSHILRRQISRMIANLLREKLV